MNNSLPPSENGDKKVNQPVKLDKESQDKIEPLREGGSNFDAVPRNQGHGGSNEAHLEINREDKRKNSFSFPKDNDGK